jgi:hypothetical protein
MNGIFLACHPDKATIFSHKSQVKEKYAKTIVCEDIGTK